METQPLSHPRSHLLRWLDRWLAIVTTALIVALAYTAVTYEVIIKQERNVVTFTLQQVGRFSADGMVLVPHIQGYDSPAIHLGGTVPVFGFRIVNAGKAVSLSGTRYWQQIPPGVSFADSPTARLVQPGIVKLEFENVIPDDVAAFVAKHGATQWQLRGSVKVHEQHALDTSWETETFWIVP